MANGALPAHPGAMLSPPGHKGPISGAWGAQGGAGEAWAALPRSTHGTPRGTRGSSIGLSMGCRGHIVPKCIHWGAGSAFNGHERDYIGPLTRKPRKAVFGVFCGIKPNLHATYMPI